MTLAGDVSAAAVRMNAAESMVKPRTATTVTIGEVELPRDGPVERHDAMGRVEVLKRPTV